MNIVYLAKDEIGRLIPRRDRRWAHVAKILKKGPGDIVAAGSSDASLGEARIEAMDHEGIVFSYAPRRTAPPLRPLRLLMGFPRPIQAGRVLKDLTSLGVEKIWFVQSELGEKSYVESSFFKTKEYGSHLIEGAEQAGNPRLPEVRCFWSLKAACDALTEEEGALNEAAEPPTKLVFHPNPKAPALASLSRYAAPVTLAIGSERGWTEKELAFFDARGFAACRLGDRILKTETAALAAASIVLSRLGFM